MLINKLQRYWTTCSIYRQASPDAQSKMLANFLPTVARKETHPVAKAKLQYLIMTEKERLEVA